MNNYDNDMYESGYSVEEIVSKRIKGSFLWMIIGLLITGAVGYGFISYLQNVGVSENFFRIIPILALVEVAVVIAFSALTYKASSSVLKLLFVVYSILNGITLPLFLIQFGIPVMLMALSTTIIVFTVTAIYGYTTKADLSKYGTYLFIGLIALLIVSVINFFMRSEMMYYLISYIGVAIFTAYTAYDVNVIKKMIIQNAYSGNKEVLNKIEIIGGLKLYLDFINLLIYMVRIFGRKR